MEFEHQDVNLGAAVHVSLDGIGVYFAACLGLDLRLMASMLTRLACQLRDLVLPVGDDGSDRLRCSFRLAPEQTFSDFCFRFFKG